MQSQLTNLLSNVSSSLGSALVWQDRNVSVYAESEAVDAICVIRVVYADNPQSIEQLEAWLISLECDFAIAVLERSSALKGVELSFDSQLTSSNLDKLAQCELLEHFVITKTLPQLNRPGLLVMDMDSTAIEIECIDELAKLAGVGAEVSEVTERAMQGELDFEQSLRQRVAKLKGADRNIIAELCHNLPVTAGLALSIKELKTHGWRTVVASGGFTPFVNHLKSLLNLDTAHANELVFEGQRFTGEVTGQVVDAEYKAKVLVDSAEQWAIDAEQTVAIGDGANDIPMLAASGFGLAFHAKPKLQAVADQHIAKLDLGCLPFLMRFA